MPNDTPQIDYAAIAKQAGAISSQPAGGNVDYAALARQSGATGYQPPATQGQTPGASQITGISPQPKSTGWLNDAENTVRDAANDVRYGTGTTMLGRGLQALGAPGTSSGVSQATGDFMGSPILGPLRAALGLSELPQAGKRWQGTKDVVGGALETAQIPGSFAAGPTETGANLAGRAGLRVFGNVEHAGQLFDTVRSAAGDTPIAISDDVYNALTNIKQLADAGAKGTPGVASKLANRLSNVDEELYWDEARRFYTNISRLSANEYNSMAPQMQRAVGQLGQALGDVLKSTADSVGAGDQYLQAMSEYARSKTWQQLGSNAWQFLKRAAPTAVGIGAGGRLAIDSLLPK
jgi:hypothetical protein